MGDEVVVEAAARGGWGEGADGADIVARLLSEVTAAVEEATLALVLLYCYREKTRCGARIPTASAGQQKPLGAHLG